MYFFILEVKFPSICQNFLVTRFSSSLFFPGMSIHFSLSSERGILWFIITSPAFPFLLKCKIRIISNFWHKIKENSVYLIFPTHSGNHVSVFKNLYSVIEEKLNKIATQSIEAVDYNLCILWLLFWHFLRQNVAVNLHQEWDTSKCPKGGRYGHTSPWDHSHDFDFFLDNLHFDFSSMYHAMYMFSIMYAVHIYST